MVIIDEIVSFFVDNFPSWEAIAVGGPAGLAWAALCLRFSGYLKRTRGKKTGYTRKVFHFLIFTAAGVLHFVGGFPVVLLLGTTVSAVVLYAVWRGDGHPFYEAIARPGDAPRRSLFVIVPLATTAIGGRAGWLPGLRSPS